MAGSQVSLLWLTPSFPKYSSVWEDFTQYARAMSSEHHTLRLAFLPYMCSTNSWIFLHSSVFPWCTHAWWTVNLEEVVGPCALMQFWSMWLCSMPVLTVSAVETLCVALTDQEQIFYTQQKQRNQLRVFFLVPLSMPWHFYRAGCFLKMWL